MDKQYIRDQYHQAMLEYKAAINEDAQWEARRTMARLEALAIEMFGEGFQKELREKEQIEPEAAQEAGTRGAPRRYRQGTDGQMHRSWNGKLPEEFSEMDALAFLVDTDLQLNGTISQDTLAALDQAGYIYKDGLVQAKELQTERPSETARFIEEYAGKIEKLVEDNKNFPVEDSSIFPFEISNGSRAAVRYAYIRKSGTFKDMQAAESGVELNVTAAIYRDGTLNEYDQGIEERKFVVKGTDAINGFLEKLGQSVADGVKAHPDIQPVVTVNFSEYDSFNPLVKEHMRLTLDRANSLFELINIVAGDAGAKGHKASYQTSADIMYVQDGQIKHFDLRQEFGKSGSIIKHLEGYMDDQIKYWERHRTLPDGESRLKEWETAKRELVPYFERHISLSSAERDLAYLGKAAPVMQDHIFEMRAFLNTGMIVSVPERIRPIELTSQEPAEDMREITQNRVQEQVKEALGPGNEPAPEEKQPDRVYLSLPPVSKGKFPAMLQELKQNGAKFDKERKQWYTDRKSTESGVFNAYLWTYLTLPSMKREEFVLLVNQLKQDGARFDQGKKRWYIDGNCARDKFLAYLESGLQEQKRTGQEAALQMESGRRSSFPGQAAPDAGRLDPVPGKRLSVLGQLEKAKETAPGHEMGDQARGARLSQHERAI